MLFLCVLCVFVCLQAYQAAKASRGLYDRADLVHDLYSRVSSSVGAAPPTQLSFLCSRLQALGRL